MIRRIIKEFCIVIFLIILNEVILHGSFGIQRIVDTINFYVAEIVTLILITIIDYIVLRYLFHKNSLKNIFIIVFCFFIFIVLLELIAGFWVIGDEGFEIAYECAYSILSLLIIVVLTCIECIFSKIIAKRSEK